MRNAGTPRHYMIGFNQQRISKGSNSFKRFAASFLLVWWYLDPARSLTHWGLGFGTLWPNMAQQVRSSQWKSKELEGGRAFWRCRSRTSFNVGEVIEVISISDLRTHPKSPRIFHLNVGHHNSNPTICGCLWSCHWWKSHFWCCEEFWKRCFSLERSPTTRSQRRASEKTKLPNPSPTLHQRHHQALFKALGFWQCSSKTRETKFFSHPPRFVIKDDFTYKHQSQVQV